MDYQTLTEERRAEIARDHLRQAEEDHYRASLRGDDQGTYAATAAADAASAALAELGAPAVLPPPPPEPEPEA